MARFRFRFARFSISWPQVKPKPGSLEIVQVWPDITNGSPGLDLKNGEHSQVRVPHVCLSLQFSLSLCLNQALQASQISPNHERTMTALPSKLCLPLLKPRRLINHFWLHRPSLIPPPNMRERQEVPSGTWFAIESQLFQVNEKKTIIICCCCWQIHII